MAAHMRDEIPSTTTNTTDPFSADYVDPALSKRQRRRAQRQAARAAGEGGGGLGWTLLYLLAAGLVAALVWVLFGAGV